jgi:hypothetical protein
MTVSDLSSEAAGEITPPHGQVPADRERADSKQRGNRRSREPVELVHHDNGSTPWRQRVERMPHAGPGDQDGLLIRVRGGGVHQVTPAALPHSRLAPLIAADVDQYADEPRLFACGAGRD